MTNVNLLNLCLAEDNMRKTIDVVTMGCSKNLVDSERVIKMFEETGFSVKHNAENFDGDVVVINTCGFIGDAKEESIEMILNAIAAKNDNAVKEIYVMGCLSERYREELKAEMPEVDGWYGKFDWTSIASDLSKRHPACAAWDRVITTPRHYAYLKIAEGCNRFCSFCAIPLITGRYKSRKIEDLLEEVRSLVGRGVKEFNVIAQDLSSYGIDIYGEHRLAELIDRMADIDGVEWIRLHYAYPADFPWDVLDVMARRDNVCKYLDVALQHVSDKVLSNMRRHIDAEGTRRFLDKVRSKVPGIHIRTTLMVGFPGEGDAEFEELKNFVSEQKFERMGAFAYCEEDDTYGAKNFTDNITQETKGRRLDEIMIIQEDISLEHNRSKIGLRMKVIIDSVGDDYYVGRSEYDSPEVDPEVLVEKSEELRPGDFVNVEIIDAMPFELFGKIVK